MTRLPEVADCYAVDFAPGAIAAARRMANDAGIANIRYEVTDLNTYAWEPDQFDLVITNGALHHLSNLEDVLAGVRRTLKPGGLFYSCEYMGPSHQDHSPRQLELINSAAFLIPSELRARIGFT
jgi:ubiquinone/menaquinone biosynthesis C-methylase UbiE